MFTRILSVLLVVFLSNTLIAQEKIHPAAKYLVKSLQNAELTPMQLSSINEKAAEMSEKIKSILSDSSLTHAMMKKRNAASKELKKNGLKGKELWTAANEKAGLSELQGQAASNIDGLRKQLRKDSMKLLSDEQKTRLNAAVEKQPMVDREPAETTELGEIIFEDDFNRDESQEKKDEVGNGWKTNSNSRAKGNKQVDLKDGAMHITMHKDADHSVSVTHAAGFCNGAVQLRFMLENEKDSLGLNFADQKFKEVHAGHLCMTKISTRNVIIDDLKTGKMANAIRAARKAGEVTEEMKTMLATKTKRVANRLEPGKWHDLLVQIKDDTLSVAIDGEVVSQFSSEGIAHPTKRMLRLAVPKKASVDDLRIFSSK